MSSAKRPSGNIFPKWTNLVVPFLLLGAMAGLPYKLLLIGLGANPTTVNVGYAPEQPIPYSHALHVGQLGLDCRYCHTTVDKAGFAAIPPLETCMNCHHAVKTDSPHIKEIHKRFYAEDPATKKPNTLAGQPMPWVKVHDLADYSYFNHSAHINKGVSCVSCHGRVDQMEVVYQAKPLSMGWCLKCHRDPAENIRPKEDVYDLNWGNKLTSGQVDRLKAIGFDKAAVDGQLSDEDRLAIGKILVGKYKIRTPMEMSDCSKCHR